MPLLLLLLIGVPVIEIALFIEIGGYIGLWPTLAAILVTAVVGAMLVRAQGLATLARAQTELDSGRLPVKQLFDGVCILVAGAFLLTPGFMTDALGLALLIPGLRLVIGRALMKMVADRKGFRMHVHGTGYSSGPDGPIVDGEFEDVTRPNEPEEPPRRLDPGDRPNQGKR